MRRRLLLPRLDKPNASRNDDGREKQLGGPPQPAVAQRIKMQPMARRSDLFSARLRGSFETFSRQEANAKTSACPPSQSGEGTVLSAMDKQSL
jgi:hypothetical protein